jgi:hypothetical protein
VATFWDQTFTDAEIDVEADEYINCTFIRCKLIYTGGPSRMTNCHLIAPILALRGPAARTIQFLKQHGYTPQHRAGVRSFESYADPNTSAGN